MAAPFAGEREAPPDLAGLRVWSVLKRARGFGGQQLQARRVAGALIQRGVDLRFLTRGYPPSARRALKPLELPHEDLPCRSHPEFAWSVYRRLVAGVSDYDLVHVHGFDFESVAAILAARRTGKPLLLHPAVTGPDTLLHRWGALTRAAPALRRSLWRTPHAWCSMSEAMTADLVRLGAPADRIVPMPNGVDQERFRPPTPDERLSLRRKLETPAEAVVLATCCRLAPTKRVDLLLRRFEAIAATDSRVRLWVLGSGEMASALEEQARRSPAGDRIRLWGPVASADVPDYLRASDVFALVSVREGLSNALLEAMACGLAPVVTATSGAADVIEPEANGLIAPIEDEAAIGAALQRMVRDDALRERCGGAAAQTITARYGLGVTADRLLRAYRLCLERAGVR